MDASQEPTQDPTQQDPPRVTKQKLEPKIKNPKRVEQGKRLAAHNKKMKEQLAKGLIESSPAADKPATIPEWALKWGGLAIGIGIGILLLKWQSGKNQPDYFLEMEPVAAPAPVPIHEPKPTPEPEPEPEPELIMD